MDNDITIKTGDEGCLSEIEELWSELNQLHLEKSLHFKHHYESLTFQVRKEALLSKANQGKMRVTFACHEDIKVGYSIASVVDGTGEIDSIYVKPDFRGRHVGKTLMETSLGWIRENDVTAISISVSVGNEDVFGFYAGFGFQPRLTVLQYCTEQS